MYIVYRRDKDLTRKIINNPIVEWRNRVITRICEIEMKKENTIPIEVLTDTLIRVSRKVDHKKAEFGLVDLSMDLLEHFLLANAVGREQRIEEVMSVDITDSDDSNDDDTYEDYDVNDYDFDNDMYCSTDDSVDEIDDDSVDCDFDMVNECDKAQQKEETKKPKVKNTEMRRKKESKGK